MPEGIMTIAIGKRRPHIFGIRVTWLLVLIFCLGLCLRLGSIFRFFVRRPIQVIEHTFARVGIGVGW